MPTCGHCKQPNQTIEHIRGCAAQQRVMIDTQGVTGMAKKYVESRDFKPMALAHLPESKYALEVKGELRFYEVTYGKPGTKWDGALFIDHLVGHPGDWSKRHLRKEEYREVKKALQNDPLGAAVRFSKEFTVCAACGSPLSDEESRARGLGPICAEKF